MSVSNPSILSGKVALVTGGSRGIGAAISRHLAALGATVLVNYNTSSGPAQKVVTDIRAAGGKAHAIGGNVGVPADVDKLFAEIDKTHGGKLDILVNNAGVYITGMLVEATSEDYSRSFDVNVRAVFEVTRRAAKRLNANGRIITIGSIIGERVPFPGGSIYAATKFAVAGFSRGWAREFASQGITVNVVQPGPIDTDMNPDNESNAMAGAMRAMVPLGRYGKAEEVAAVVGFVASPAAAFVNGATINVDGGVIA
ncbi:MAG: 3-oxoacyl-ACP reductase FabG [Planctomycetota bacterium]|nr:3-oxoacyl-ACP reductase FabG [Planctomycetota bacterium]